MNEIGVVEVELLRGRRCEHGWIVRWAGPLIKGTLMKGGNLGAVKTMKGDMRFIWMLFCGVLVICE